MKNLVRLLLLSVFSIASTWAAPHRDRYYDPTDRRIHAAVEPTIENGQLNLSISAIGAEVEPLPGFRGHAGSNLQTAFEITQLFASDRLEVITTDAFGNRMPNGYLTAGKRGHIPLRSIDSKGRITFDAFSKGEYLLDFSANGGALPAGEFRTELWARGEPRLRVDYQIDPSGNGDLLNFVEIGHGKKLPENASQQFRYIDTEGGEVKEQLPPPVEAAVWESLDFEARWSHYKKSLDAGKTNTTWVSFLIAEKDYLFLETIAMHEIDTFGNEAIGQKLKSADAPNWLRLTFWMAEDKRPRGHGGMVTDGLIHDKAKQDVITTWLKAHKLAEKHPTIIKNFNAEEPKPKDIDVSNHLPPHDPAKIFHLLDAPAKLAAPDIQKVKRTIDGLATSGRYEAPWMGKLNKLRTHPEPAIRQAVYLSLTHMGADRIPWDALTVVNDKKEDARVREAALLTYSYGDHFEVYPVLVDFAATPAHPAWRASTSRLVGLADPYLVEIINGVKVESPEDEAFLKTSQEQIKAQATLMTTKHIAALAPNLLRRYGWMKATGHERAEDYLKSLEPTIQENKALLNARLLKLSTEKLTPVHGASEERQKHFESMNATVQKLAKQYTDGP